MTRTAIPKDRKIRVKTRGRIGSFASVADVDVLDADAKTLDVERFFVSLSTLTH